MIANATEGQNSVPHDLEAQTTEETITALVEVVEKQQQQIDDLQERVSDLEDDLDEQDDDLDEERDTRAKDDAQLRQRITAVEDNIDDLEDDQDDATPTPEAGNPPEKTPIERLSDGGDEDVSEHVTSSIERALTLFEHIRDWGKKTPKGITLRPEDSPKKLLEAATGETLAWQQYYRAAEALERLSKGAVTFFDHRKHGKTVVLHEDTGLYDRLATDTGRSQPSLVAD